MFQKGYKKMKKIVLENTDTGIKWEIIENERGLYDCYYYEYFKSIQEYRYTFKELNYTKDAVEYAFGIRIL